MGLLSFLKRCLQKNQSTHTPPPHSNSSIPQSNLGSNEVSQPIKKTEQTRKKVDDEINHPIDAATHKIQARLDALDELSQREFNRLRKHPNYFTIEDIWMLEAMERSHAYAKEHQKKTKIFVDKLSSITPTDPVYLKAKEILFLWYIDSHKITTERLNIPGYWTHTYHLDYQAVLEKLISSGYLQFSTIKDSIALYKLSDIKEFLKQKGLSLTGKKQVLIDRICENCSENDIVSAFPDKTFKATPLGEQLIVKNEYLVYFHQNMNQFNISLEQAEKAHKENETLNKYELALFILNNKSSKYIRERNYGLYHNTLYGKSIVYKDMDCFEPELSFLLQMVFLGFNGFSNNGVINKGLSIIAPGITARIKLNPYYISCTEEELYAFFKNCVTSLPIQNLDGMINESFNALQSELNNKGDIEK